MGANGRMGSKAGVGQRRVTVAERRVATDEGLPLRLYDVVITAGCTLATAYLVIACRWVPGWEWGALGFAVAGSGPPILRALARKYPRVRALEWLASFWLLPAALILHDSLRPLIDGIRPTLMDRSLALADLRLFGGMPADLLARYLPAPVIDVLMCCYYTYVVWPVVVAVAMYRHRREVHDQYLLAFALCFALNWVCYALVPAVGPRFYLVGWFDGPVPGTAVTQTLESAMRLPHFVRDCFPSGHVAGTVLGLCFAWRHKRWLFWAGLPTGVGLILATLVGRFHYGVDVLASVPLVAVSIGISAALCKVRPRGVVVPDPVLVYRAAMRA